jgi:hypothetical protein
MAGAALVISAVAAVGTGVATYVSSQQAAAAQKSLADQQKDQLAAEQQKASADAAAAAVGGQTFGERVQGPLATGLGFGTGNPAPANTGRAQLTGLG